MSEATKESRTQKAAEVERIDAEIRRLQAEKDKLNVCWVKGAYVKKSVGGNHEVILPFCHRNAETYLAEDAEIIHGDVRPASPEASGNSGGLAEWSAQEVAKYKCAFWEQINKSLMHACAGDMGALARSNAELDDFITRFAPSPKQPDAEPVGYALKAYDAGLLGMGGGGDVDWWQDYLRAELERAHEYYQSQVDALTHPAPASAPKLAAGAVDHVKAIAQWYENGRREHLMCWPVKVGNRSYNVTVAPHDPSGYVTPLTVAPVSVVQSIKNAAFSYAMRAKAYGADECRDEDVCEKWDEFTAALAKIVELPEPSEWDLDWNEYIKAERDDVTIKPYLDWKTIDLNREQALQFAAALIEAAAKEGK